MEQEEAKRRSKRPSPAPIGAYDPIEVLTNTLEGVAAMEEYKLDADAANAPRYERPSRGLRTRSGRTSMSCAGWCSPVCRDSNCHRSPSQARRRTTHDAAFS